MKWRESVSAVSTTLGETPYQYGMLLSILPVNMKVLNLQKTIKKITVIG